MLQEALLSVLGALPAIALTATAQQHQLTMVLAVLAFLLELQVQLLQVAHTVVANRLLLSLGLFVEEFAVVAETASSVAEVVAHPFFEHL